MADARGARRRASPVASRAAPLPQAASGIPPFVWSLTSFPGVGAIAEPGRYTVQFMADGTVAVGADCNRAAGVWSGGDGAIDITVTLSTLALCPEDSLGDAVPASARRGHRLHRVGRDVDAARLGRRHDVLGVTSDRARQPIGFPSNPHRRQFVVSSALVPSAGRVFL